MPEVREEAVELEAPDDHAYVYPDVPPTADAVADPSLPPLQLTLLSREMLAISTEGWVMLMEGRPVGKFNFEGETL